MSEKSKSKRERRFIIAIIIGVVIEIIVAIIAGFIIGFLHIRNNSEEAGIVTRQYLEKRPDKIFPALTKNLSNFPSTRVYGRKLRSRKTNRIYCRAIVPSFVKALEYDYGDFIIRMSYFSTKSGAFRWYNWLPGKTELRNQENPSCYYVEDLHTYGFRMKMRHNNCRGCKNCSHLIFVYKNRRTIEIYPQRETRNRAVARRRNRKRALEILRHIM